MKQLKTIIIYSIIIFSCLCAIPCYFVATQHGAKLLLNTAIILNNQSNNISINKISGNILDGLVLQDIIYSQAEYNLHIKTVTIKINWLEFIKKQNISININKLSGSLNNEPLIASINFSKKHNYIKFNANSFIKIGDNILNIEQTSNNQQISFNIIANQLNLFNKQATGTITINGNLSNDLGYLKADISTKKLVVNGIDLGSFLISKHNTLTFIAKQTNNNKVSTELEVDFQDISPIMDFVPNITRLKGKLQGTIKFNGNTKEPRFTTNLALKDLTMSLPEYGIKIKPLNLYLTAKNDKTIFINGKGVMRNGPGEFNLKGHFEPLNPDFPNSLEIYGEGIECINTPGYHLITSLQLKLAFLLKQNALQITGDLSIPEGTIDLDKQKQSTIIKSNDIVFADQTNTIQPNKKNYLKILPSINLRIKPEIRLLGKGLNTTISGKLKIYTNENNDSLLGSGRISIKHGIYNLSGQEFLIEKGIIIYLPGTLISNPSLDIKISPNKETTNINKTNEQSLYIEGTLEHPIIKDSGLVNERQAVLQLLNFGNHTITSSIKEKFHLQEFGIVEDEAASRQFKNKTSDESLLDNKNFVVGKKINNKIHLQYLKNLSNTNNTVRLKYKLNNYWSIGIESSTDDGHGADVGFSIEK